MPRTVIILNPTAGRRRGQALRSRLEALLNSHKGWEIRETSHRGHGRELARQAQDEGAEIVAAAGGDGTLSEVLNGLMSGSRGSALAVIPAGTGNDFARHLGIGINLELAVNTLFEGEAKPIDIGKITLSGQSHFWLNICGCGFDAKVAHRINTSRSHPLLRHIKGTPAYIAAVGGELLRLRATALRLELDGQATEERTVLCAIANSSSYGGGMLVAPEASLHDGLFDLCTIGDASRMEFVRAFPGVFSGRHVKHPKVTMRRAASIRLESNRPLPVLVDGDVLGTTPAEIDMLPCALRVLFPREGRAA
jgi:diacylglycerol kinase (ATP)